MFASAKFLKSLTGSDPVVRTNNNGVINAKVVLENASNNIIRSDAEKLIVIDGLHDYIIVDKEGVLLIYPKSKEQDIKRITALANDLK